MLDVEFLLAPPPFESPLIYRYRSGLLTRRMLAILNDIAIQEGLMLVEKGREVLALGLFDMFPVFDWPASRNRKPTPDELGSLIEAIDQGERSAFFVSNHVQLDENPIWQKAVKNCTLVTEELVTIETLAPTLRFFEATTDLPIDPGTAFTPSLLEQFEEIAGRQGELLSTVLNRFDELMLAVMDTKGQAVPVKALEHNANGKESRLRSLRALLVGCDVAEVPSLISSFASYYWRDRRSRLDVVRELYRITEELLFQQGPRRGLTSRRFPGHDTVIDEQVIVLWTALLLAWEGRLIRGPGDAFLSYRRTPDLQMTYIDSMARELLSLGGNLAGGAELRRFVRGLVATLPQLDQNSPDPLQTSRERMLNELKVMLSQRFVRKYPWWSGLEIWVTNALVKESGDQVVTQLKQEAPHPAVAQSGIDIKPTAFGEMIGRKGTVTALRRRARDPEKTTGMILFGPSGMGKRTLGRIFAKALLCEATTIDGDACDRCDECKAFSRKASAGYIEVAGGKLDVATARDVASRVGRVSIAERSVVVIADVDRADPAAIDALLKSIETDDLRTIFVVTASRLKDVRMALQSRCERRRVYPLNHEESLLYVWETGGTLGANWEPEVFDLVNALGRGVPHALNELSAAVSTGEQVTLASAVQALGLSSASDLAEAMSQIYLSAGDAASKDRVVLSQALLTEIYLDENRVPVNGKRVLATLSHVSPTDFADCRSGFARSAQAAKMTNRRFWQKVAAEYL